MDANGTRLFMLFGEGDWSACTVENGVPFSEIIKAGAGEYPTSTSGLGWESKHNEVILHPRIVKFKAAPRDVPPVIDDRRGSGCDRYGNWYWIGSAKDEILVNSAGTGVTSHFWSSADQYLNARDIDPGDFHAKEAEPSPFPCDLQGLAVTEDHYLIVGTLNPAGLLVFDLHSGGPPKQIIWPESVAFAPFDMSTAPGGGVWILDRTNKRYWRLDRNLNVVNDSQTILETGPIDNVDFRPGAGSAQQQKPGLFPSGITLAVPSPLASFDPISIEGLPDGTVLILDANPSLGSSTVSRYRFGEQFGRPVKLEEFGLIAHDFAFIAEHESDEGTIPDRLYVASAEGNQTFAFEISLGPDGNLLLELLNEYYPMRLFGGKALVRSGTTVYYDFSDSWVPLVQQLRPQYSVEGMLQTPDGTDRPPFDGRVPDCVWHRFMLDACIPPGSAIDVESRAANDFDQLKAEQWQQEPSLRLRGNGSELPFMPRDKGRDSGTWELLFQRAVGRYLQLRLTFRGSGRETPRLRCLRVYAPRFSYLKEYLPALYRDDETSASFLDRFLANFEGTFTAIEDRIAAVQMLFDAGTAPSETLDWLAGWLGVSLDPNWDESRRRLFIKHAMIFFNLRGTLRGLKLALRLVLDDPLDEAMFDEVGAGCSSDGGVRIIEKFRTRTLPAVMLGDPTESSGLRTVTATRRWQPVQGRD
ncbi:MAG: phage tail protein, partial [Chloroflexi bacterium]|nr:phage tail protein [Chloroflexota bacterium]